MLIVIALLVERYFYTKEMTAKLTQTMEAVMSKNMGDYVSARTVAKNTESSFAVPDDIDIEQATESEFMKHIEKQTQ